MIDKKKVDEVRKKTRKAVKDQPMVIHNEPDHSGKPHNTIQKDIEEQQDDDERRKQEGCEGET